MDLLSVIRRWHGRGGLSIRKIARRTGLSRHTTRKYLNSGVVQPKHPPRQGVSKLNPFAETLATWLQRDARHRIWQDEPQFKDLAALNRWPEARCQALWHEARHPEFSDRLNPDHPGRHR